MISPCTALKHCSRCVLKLFIPQKAESPTNIANLSAKQADVYLTFDNLEVKAARTCNYQLNLQPIFLNFIQQVPF